MFKLIASGMPNYAIAETLNVTKSTIDEDIRWWRVWLGVDAARTPLQELAERTWSDDDPTDAENYEDAI